MTATEDVASARSVRQLLATQGVRQSLLLAVLLLSTLLFPKSIPLGIFGLGATAGVALALQAVGIVLIYRSNRIINFAQISVGAFGAAVFDASATYRPLLRWFAFVCGDECGSTAVTVNYWISLVVGVALAPALSGLVYLVVIRRFANAPRMLLTVATIFVGPALFSAFPYILDLFSTDEQENDLPFSSNTGAGFPIKASFTFDDTVFRLIDVISVVIGVLLIAALFVFLRRSKLGIAIRASSENPDRASTLGIDVGRATSRIWLMAGLLSGVTSVLAVAGLDRTAAFGGANAQLLLLTAAAIAALTSLPLTLAACVVLGMVKQAAFWAYSSSAPFTGSLMLILVATFLLQGRAASRGEVELASTLAASREIRNVPRELAGLSAVKAWRRTLVAVVVVLVGGSPVLLAPVQVDALTTVLLLAIMALSLLVLTGWGGQISLGQIGFAGVGAYVAAVSHLPFYAALPLGVLSGAVIAVVIGLPALRLRGLHLAIMSLALAVTMNQLLIDPAYGGKALPKDLPRPHPLGIDLEDARVFYYLALICLVLALLAVVGLRRSRTARALLAARDNELAAQSLGINLLRARLAAFAISGGLAAFGGVLLAYQQHAVQTGTFTADAGITIFQSSVLGGLGHVMGPLLGIAAMQLPPIFDLPTLISVLISGVGALAVILTIPGGIAQALFDARDDFLRRLAKREGITVPALQGQRGAEGDELAPLLPRSEGTGSDEYVPSRYRLEGQWAMNVSHGDTPHVVHEALTGAVSGVKGD